MLGPGERIMLIWNESSAYLGGHKLLFLFGFFGVFFDANLFAVLGAFCLYEVYAVGCDFCDVATLFVFVLEAAVVDASFYIDSTPLFKVFAAIFS